MPGNLIVQNSTVTGNTANRGGGGIAGGAVSLESCVVVGNSALFAPDLGASSVNARTSSIFSHAGITVFTDLGGNRPAGEDPRLSPLQNNGGPTKTHALLPGSPCINAGSNPANLTTDQRGPNHPRVVGSAADIGAFEIGAPAVSSVVVDDGSAQRSRVTSLTVTFSTQVTFAGAVASAFTLTRTSGGAVNFAATANVIGGVTVVTLTSFTGNETQFGSLKDGRYTLTALASQISAGGMALDGNGDGTPGDNFAFGEAQGLFRFYGDINGDRHVDIADFGLFSSTLNLHAGQTGFLAAFDFNGDGVIDIADFGQFSVRMFTVLP
jgi:hypothetical protein